MTFGSDRQNRGKDVETRHNMRRAQWGRHTEQRREQQDRQK
jgi:hypothetical protein